MVTGWVRVGVIALVGLAVLVGVGLWVRSNSGATATTQPGTMMQTNEDGQITIKATWQGRGAGPVFAVEMDTHVVNLDGYDLKQLAVLRTDQGQEIQPVSWNAPTGRSPSQRDTHLPGGACRWDAADGAEYAQYRTDHP